MIKKFSLALLIIVVLSCNINQTKNSDTKRLSDFVQINLEKIKFSIEEVFFIQSGDTIHWYYPYQMVFYINVSNKTNDTLFFVSNDSAYKNEHNIFGETGMVIEGKKHIIVCRWPIEMLPKSENFIIGYNIDFPFFQKVYTKKEFAKFLDDFVFKYKMYCYPVVKDYSQLPDELKYCDRSDSDSLRINISKSFKFTVAKYGKKQIQVSDIGYPNEIVPDSIELFPPPPGIEY